MQTATDRTMSTHQAVHSRDPEGRGGLDGPDVRHPLKVWPYTWGSVARFAAAFVVMTAVWTATGFAVVEWLEPSRLGRAEADVNTWFEDRRTDGWNTVAELASIPSDTFVKIGLMAALAIVFAMVFRRWHDWAFLLGALLLEVSVYGLSSFLVGRPRPPVERLTTAPTESFPSGHMAAAVVFYFGLVLIAHWRTTQPWVRALAWFVAVAVAVGMFISRLYLGMHYVSDMVGGVVLGVVSLLVTHRIISAGLASTVSAEDEPLPAHTTRLDLVA